jgi:hypothetical protein
MHTFVKLAPPTRLHRRVAVTSRRDCNFSACLSVVPLRIGYGLPNPTNSRPATVRFSLLQAPREEVLSAVPRNRSVNTRTTSIT